MTGAWTEYLEIEDLRRSIAAVRREAALLQFVIEERKAGFDPNQPRVPAGHPDGGQWTRIGGGLGPRYAEAGRYADPRVMSDANPEPLIPAAQYAQTQIRIDPSALLGISRIDDITVKLTEILAGVVDTVEYLPNMGPAVYGTFIHTAFGRAVRQAKLPSIGYFDVETTFSLEEDEPSYGARLSIRTDVILRNEIGEIIAIYDVKTGGAKLKPKRKEEIRRRTGAADHVPIFEMHILHGITRKGLTKSDRHFWIIFVRLWGPLLPDIQDEEVGPSAAAAAR